MKLTILAVVILALGIAVGLVLHGQLDGSAAAAPPCPPKCATPTATPTPTPPPQQREDQIVLGATGAANQTTFSYVGGTRAPWIAFDAGDYPSSSVFRLEFIIDLGADQTTCVRLFDLTTDSAIPASTMCATGAPSPQSQIDRRRLRSDPLTLPAGEHEYTLQGQSEVSIGGSSVQFSRIIVEWTE